VNIIFDVKNKWLVYRYIYTDRIVLIGFYIIKQNKSNILMSLLMPVIQGVSSKGLNDSASQGG